MENAIKIQVPIFVSYPALEDVLKKQMVGEYIPRPEEGVDEPPYAQILDIGIEGSDLGVYNLSLRIRLRILRTVLKRDQVDLLVLANLDYDSATEQLLVRKFSLDSRTPSTFYNTSLEVLANKVAHNQILKKARLNLGNLISKELQKANGMLASGLDIKGAKLSGAVEIVRILDITPEKDRVSIQLELQGNLEAEILDLISLMPPK